VAENQPQKNRMKSEFSELTARLLAFMRRRATELATLQDLAQVHGAAVNDLDREFNALALELFSLQFRENGPYRRFCESQGATPGSIEKWPAIPAVPAAAFKELDLSCLTPPERTIVFLSSGTTGQRPSRHSHNPESLAIYEESLRLWFKTCVLKHTRPSIVCLTPPASQAPQSSLVHMFDCLIREFGSLDSLFVGQLDASGNWEVGLELVATALDQISKIGNPVYLMGTAFSFVHLLEQMASKDLVIELPHGSLALETGGYKGRSRSLPKQELHKLIRRRLGLPPGAVISEYGMCELSSQAYTIRGGGGGGAYSLSSAGGEGRGEEAKSVPSTQVHGVGVLATSGRLVEKPAIVSKLASSPPPSSKALWRAGRPSPPEKEREKAPASLSFPPWARVQIISPETGREVEEGQAGLLRIFDLANVFSALAIQTEDLAIRRGDGFELIGRAVSAEPRGCSLMAAG
jgi:hypothetical protein